MPLTDTPESKTGGPALTDIEIVDLELIAPVTVAGVARTEETARALPLVVDKPPSLGGTDTGPMPSEYFLAALGSCNMMTARRIAEKRGATYTRLRCRAVAHFEGGEIAKVVLHYQVSGGDKAQWETVVRLAERTCTISRVTKCPVEREVEVV